MWVRLWVSLILVPVNLATLIFSEELSATLIMSLAVAGLAFNIIPMVLDRGFTSSMALPHVIFWLPLVVILFYLLFVTDTTIPYYYRYFLLVLLICDTISLAMDIPDSIRWLKDKRIYLNK